MTDTPTTYNIPVLTANRVFEMVLRDSFLDAQGMSLGVGSFIKMVNERMREKDLVPVFRERLMESIVKAFDHD